MPNATLLTWPSPWKGGHTFREGHGMFVIDGSEGLDLGR